MYKCRTRRANPELYQETGSNETSAGGRWKTQTQKSQHISYVLYIIVDQPLWTWERVCNVFAVYGVYAISRSSNPLHGHK
jgi:hypothetical protein